MSNKKIPHLLTVVMKGKISYIDQNNFLHQAVNILFFCCKVGNFNMGGVYGTDSLLQPASSGQSMNYRSSHVLVSRERAGGCRLYMAFASELFIIVGV